MRQPSDAMNEAYEFTNFRLDVRERTLSRRDGKRVALPDKAFDTLCILVRNAGKLVEKEVILQNVWADSFVEENNLNKSIHAIRRALGDQGGEPKFIETVKKHGFRFVAPVTRAPAPRSLDTKGPHERPAAEMSGGSVREFPRLVRRSGGAVPAVSTAQREEDDAPIRDVPASIRYAEPAPVLPVREQGSSRRPRLSTGVVVIALGVFFVGSIGLGGYFWWQRTGLREIRSVAVMPFVNETGDPQLEYLSDGMTDTLISSLSELPNIKVKARTSVFRYKGKEIDPKVIGKELGVQAIVNGHVAQRDGRTMVLLEVVDTETEDVIFSTKYDRPQSELVTLQRDIARDVSGKLKTKLSGAEEANVTKTPTADPEALQLYLQGQFYRYKGGRSNLLLATEYFNKAIEKDPNYALAYAGLALNYGSYDFYSLVPDWKKADSAAKRALELDDSLAEAHLGAGDFRRAIELNPDYADARVALCIHLTMTKRFDEGITECRKAHELDPLSVVVATRLGAAYFFANRPDESIEVLARAHETDPTLWVPLGYLGGAQTLKGQYAEAAATFRKAIEISDGSPNTKSHLAYALAKSGQRDEALKLIDELKGLAQREHISSFHFAVPYIGLGDKNEAFFWLGKGIDDGTIGFRMLDVHPWFDELRSDPRFEALLKRANQPS